MLKKFPGLIDVHVHLRDPGATHKEDFDTGTRAALAGGFTFVLDMPNNPTPTISIDRLEEKVTLARQKAKCGLGFHYGTDGSNLESFVAASRNKHVFGLKIYCNHTTGTLLVEDHNKLDGIVAAWNSKKPMLVHAEGDELLLMLELAAHYNRRLHVCHISQAVEVEAVRKAKKSQQQVSAGVTPHHLFLTQKDVKALGSFAIMKPPLGTQDDQDGLWEGIRDRTIDLVETDHAPHTREEKDKDPAPFGIPGLESALGLMLRAVHDGRVTEQDVIRLMHDAPKTIFAIPDQPDTYVTLDPAKPYAFGKHGYASKCDWSPFEGWELYGRVEQVYIRGKVMYL